jgi:hypothetical protein
MFLNPQNIFQNKMGYILGSGIPPKYVSSFSIAILKTYIYIYMLKDNKINYQISDPLFSDPKSGAMIGLLPIHACKEWCV